MPSRLSGNANSYARNPAQEQARSAAEAARRRAQQASAAQVAQSRSPAVPTAPAAPAPAPTPPAASPMPWDAAYEGSVDSINKGRDQGYAAIDEQVRAAKQAYGFDDTTDPFSKIAMFKEAFANQKRGINTTSASRGQLFSGGQQTDQANAQHQNDIGYDALRRDYDSTLNDLAARRSQVGQEADDSTAAAGFTRVQTALQSRPDPTTAPATGTTMPGTKAQAGTDSKGNAGTWHIYPDGHKVFVKGK